MRSLLVLPSLWSLKKKSGSLVIKVSEMTSKLHFWCPQHHFECKKLPFEKTFFRLSLIMTYKKCGRCVQNFDVVFQSSFLCVQKNISRIVFQRTSSCFSNFWNSKGCLTFLLQVFRDKRIFLKLVIFRNV